MPLHAFRQAGGDVQEEYRIGPRNYRNVAGLEQTWRSDGKPKCGKNAVTEGKRLDTAYGQAQRIVNDTRSRANSPSTVQR